MTEKDIILTKLDYSSGHEVLYIFGASNCREYIKGLVKDYISKNKDLIFAEHKVGKGGKYLEDKNGNKIPKKKMKHLQYDLHRGDKERGPFYTKSVIEDKEYDVIRIADSRLIKFLKNKSDKTILDIPTADQNDNYTKKYDKAYEKKVDELASDDWKKRLEDGKKKFNQRFKSGRFSS